MTLQQLLVSALLSIPMGLISSNLILRWRASRLAAIDKARELEQFRSELLTEIHNTLASFSGRSSDCRFLDYLGIDNLAYIQSMLHDFKHDADKQIELIKSSGE